VAAAGTDIAASVQSKVTPDRLISDIPRLPVLTARRAVREAVTAYCRDVLEVSERQ